jgi:type IV pilus assembly protein PilV
MTIIKNKLRHGVRQNAGFTLLEVLVSLVILAIGLLGIAKLMLFSSHANDSAYLRSQATALAYEILDDMRANRQEAINTPLTYTTAAAAPALPPGAMCVGLGSCNSPTQVGLYDVYQWGLHLRAPAGALPNGQGSVALATVGGQTTATIIVSLDDSAAQKTLNPGSAITQSITLETVL